MKFYCRAKLLVLTGLAPFTLTVPALADAALFAEHCAKCHARATSVARSLKGSSADEKSALLDKLLPAHHAPDAEVRKKIVAYLVSIASK